MNKGLINAYRVSYGSRLAKISCLIALCVLAGLIAGYLIGHSRGWNKASKAAGQIIAADLRNEATEGRSFRHRELPGVVFYPRADKALNYSIAGAGADTQRGKR